MPEFLFLLAPPSAYLAALECVGLEEAIEATHWGRNPGRGSGGSPDPRTPSMAGKTREALRGGDGCLRPSCPRLPIWEEVSDRGFVIREEGNRRYIVGLRHWGLPFFSTTNLLPANKRVSLSHLEFFPFQAFPHAIAEDFRTLVVDFERMALKRYSPPRKCHWRQQRTVQYFAISPPTSVRGT